MPLPDVPGPAVPPAGRPGAGHPGGGDTHTHSLLCLVFIVIHRLKLSLFHVYILWAKMFVSGFYLGNSSILG